MQGNRVSYFNELGSYQKSSRLSSFLLWCENTYTRWPPHRLLSSPIYSKLTYLQQISPTPLTFFRPCKSTTSFSALSIVSQIFSYENQHLVYQLAVMKQELRKKNDEGTGQRVNKHKATTTPGSKYSKRGETADRTNPPDSYERKSPRLVARPITANVFMQSFRLQTSPFLDAELFSYRPLAGMMRMAPRWRTKDIFDTSTKVRRI